MFNIFLKNTIKKYGVFLFVIIFIIMSIFNFKNYKTKRNIFFIFLSFFILTFLISFAADDVTSLQNEINNRSEQIKNLQAEIDAYNNKVAGTQAEAKTLKTAIAKLEAQKKNLLNQIDLNTLKIKNIENNISTTKNNINSNQKTIDENKVAIAKALYQIKINEDSNLLLLNLLRDGERGFGDLLNDTFKFYDLNNSLNNKINNINTSIGVLKENKNIYEKQKDNLSLLSKDLNDQKKLVLENQNDKNSLLNQTKNQEKTYQQIISDRKKKVADMQNEINDFESKIKFILDKSKLPTNNNGLSWPVKKVLITQHFGDTDFSKTGAYNGHGHNGVDFGVSIGSSVLASASGVVMGTGNTDTACARASYGKWILIKHKNGLATLYGHLSIIDVSAGQSVEVGQQIGLSGNTGYTTGPHLHFTVIAADAVRIFGPTEYKSRVCGTYMVMPYAPLNAYLNPLTYLPK